MGSAGGGCQLPLRAPERKRGLSAPSTEALAWLGYPGSPGRTSTRSSPGRSGTVKIYGFSEWPGQDSNLRATDYETQLLPACAVFSGF